MNYTAEQFDKLPKWAKLEIKRLEGNNESLTRKLNEIYTEGETNTHVREGISKRPLPKNTILEFELEKGYISVYINSNGFLDINTHSKFGAALVALPRAANSMYLTFAETK